MKNVGKYNFSSLKIKINLNPYWNVCSCDRLSQKSMLPHNTENVKPIDDFSFLNTDPFHTLWPESLKPDLHILTLLPVSHIHSACEFLAQNDLPSSQPDMNQI